MEVVSGVKDYVNKAVKSLGAYKYVLLVIAVGLILLLWPNAPPESEEGELNASLTLESELEILLGKVDGVGRVSLLLTDSGAAVVCDGAANPEVRAKVLEIVSASANLGYDKISVVKMKPNKTLGGNENGKNVET